LTFSRNITRDKSDQDLLFDFREKGDLDKLGILYSRYMHLVYGVCIKYLKDRDTAKDEVINIFEKLVSDVCNHEISNFKTWLYVVTKNHCFMLLRSRKTESEREIQMINDPTFFMEKSEEMHPLDSDKDMDESRLNDCISKLREEQRQCIVMFYYEDRCYKEISDTLKIDEKRVKSYIQNGKRNLKICLEGKYVAQEEK